MPKNDEKNVSSYQTETTLGKETLFNGNLRFDTSLTITGRYEGQIESSGFLYVDSRAEVKADITVRSVVVGGVVHGNIEAVDRLEVLEGGAVHGNVKTSRLKIADGVVFEGKCEMIDDPDAVDIFSASVAQLKRSLQSVQGR